MDADHRTADSPRNWLRSGLPKALAGAMSLLLLYSGAYLAIGESRQSGTVIERVYKHHWQASLFAPAVKVESVIRRQKIDVGVEVGGGESYIKPLPPIE
jgi:hypothetical protein